MKFSVEQKYDRAAAEVIACYCDADSYARWPTGGHLSSPEVLSVVHSQPTVTVSLRYRFVASLPSAALAIIDPDKLTWVEESIYDLNRLSSTTRLIPDHYASKLSASITTTYRDTASGSIRETRGEFRVKILLFAGQVERAIVDGIRDHLRAEQAAISQILAES